MIIQNAVLKCKEFTNAIILVWYQLVGSVLIADYSRKTIEGYIPIPLPYYLSTEREYEAKLERISAEEELESVVVFAEKVDEGKLKMVQDVLNDKILSAEAKRKLKERENERVDKIRHLEEIVELTKKESERNSVESLYIFYMSQEKKPPTK